MPAPGSKILDMNMLLKNLSEAGLLAIPVFLILIAWWFWEKDRPWARFTLSFGIIVFLVIFILEIINNNEYSWPFKKPEYTIDISTSPSSQKKWWGLYEDGSPVEAVEAKLLLDGEEKPGINAKIESSVKSENREFKAEEDPNNSDRMLIKMNEHTQGYIPYEKLENLPEFNPRPCAVAVTEEIRELDKKVGVDPETARAVKEQFTGFEMEVVAWNFRNDGVNVITSYDGKPTAEELVTREKPFSINANPNIVLALLFLDLAENDGDGKHARFLLLKYPSKSTASEPEDSPCSV